MPESTNSVTKSLREHCADLLAQCDAGEMAPVEALEDIRATLAQPEPQALTPSYIDAEHTGHDRELLETFYRACQSEGGTADEIYLRGLKAVLAQLEPPEPQDVDPWPDEELREMWLSQEWFNEGATFREFASIVRRWGRPAMDPVDDRIAELEAELERERLRLAACGVVAMADTPESASKARDIHQDLWSASLDDVIRQIDALMALRLAIEPVPVSERLPGPGEWVWHCYAKVRFWQHGQHRNGQFFVGNGPESFPATHWRPHWALPMPQQEVE
jgi:hypothetical protein